MEVFRSVNKLVFEYLKLLDTSINSNDFRKFFTKEFTYIENKKEFSSFNEFEFFFVLKKNLYSKTNHKLKNIQIKKEDNQYFVFIKLHFTSIQNRNEQFEIEDMQVKLTLVKKQNSYYIKYINFNY